MNTLKLEQLTTEKGAEEIKKYVNKGYNVFVQGPNSSGKTQLLYAITKLIDISNTISSIGCPALLILCPTRNIKEFRVEEEEDVQLLTSEESDIYIVDEVMPHLISNIIDSVRGSQVVVFSCIMCVDMVDACSRTGRGLLVITMGLSEDTSGKPMIKRIDVTDFKDNKNRREFVMEAMDVFDAKKDDNLLALCSRIAQDLGINKKIQGNSLMSIHFKWIVCLAIYEEFSKYNIDQRFKRRFGYLIPEGFLYEHLLNKDRITKCVFSSDEMKSHEYKVCAYLAAYSNDLAYTLGEEFSDDISFPMKGQGDTQYPDYSFLWGMVTDSFYKCVTEEDVKVIMSCIRESE